MSLIEQIQSEAITSGSSVPDLLRKCLVLSTQLEARDFKDWINKELQGYGNKDLIPDYRKAPLSFEMDCIAGFKFYKRYQIPLAAIKTVINKEEGHIFSLKDSIAGIYEIVKSNTEDDVVINMPDVALSLQRKGVYNGIEILSVIGRLPSGFMSNILDNTKTKILEITLEIQNKYPEINTIRAMNMTEKKELGASVNNIFNQFIHGNVGVAGVSNNSEIHMEVTKGDQNSLSKYLRDNGISDDEVTTLLAAIQKDPNPTDKNHWGDNVKLWIGGVVSNLANATGRISVAAATDVITKALMAYYGLG